MEQDDAFFNSVDWDAVESDAVLNRNRYRESNAATGKHRSGSSPAQPKPALAQLHAVAALQSPRDRYHTAATQKHEAPSTISSTSRSFHADPAATCTLSSVMQISSSANASVSATNSMTDVTNAGCNRQPKPSPALTTAYSLHPPPQHPAPGQQAAADHNPFSTNRHYHHASAPSTKFFQNFQYSSAPTAASRVPQPSTAALPTDPLRHVPPHHPHFPHATPHHPPIPNPPPSSHVHLPIHPPPPNNENAQPDTHPSRQLPPPHPNTTATAPASHTPYIPKCPYDSCPGLYHYCGGELRWVSSSMGGFWGCSLYPSCTFIHQPPEPLDNPQLSLEVISPTHFKVVALPGAEDAVAREGGVAAVLASSRVDLSAAVFTAAMEVATGRAPGGDHSGAAEREDAVVLPLAKYQVVEACLRRWGKNLLGRGSCIPAATLRSYRGGSYALADPREVERRYGRMPPGLAGALLPFQHDGVRFGLQRGGRVLLADEMGVGKTVQAIALASCYQEEWPLLVVVPASLRLVWAEEIERWMPALRPSQIHVIEGREQRLTGPGGAGGKGGEARPMPAVTITSYEMMRRLTCKACCTGVWKGGVVGGGCAGPEGCMAALPWGVVVVDESHNLRTTGSHSHDSPHTEACVSALRRAKRAVLLSGTPSLSRPFDLFRQVEALRPGLLGGRKDAFGVRYCDRRLVPAMRGGSEDRKRWNSSGGSRLYELHGLLTREVMIRRLKKDVMAQLPPKRRQVVRLPQPNSLPFYGDVEGDEEDGEESNRDSETDDEAREGSSAESGPEGGLGLRKGRMSEDHRTALAKLPDAVSWLVTMLKGSTDQQGEAARRGPKPRWRMKPLGPAAPSDAGGGEEPSGAPPKFLVFAHHRDVMDKLAEALGGHGDVEDEGEGADGDEDTGRAWRGVSYIRVDGTHDSESRLAAVRKFRDDPSVRVALLSVTAAGVGLDFSAASGVVFVEIPREVSWVRQAEDRAHRRGQRRSVNVYFLCARGTSDDRRWQQLNSSLSRITQVHDGPAPAALPAGAQGEGSGPPPPNAADDQYALALDAVYELDPTQQLTQLPPEPHHLPDHPASGADPPAAPHSELDPHPTTTTTISTAEPMPPPAGLPPLPPTGPPTSTAEPHYSSCSCQPPHQQPHPQDAPLPPAPTQPPPNTSHSSPAHTTRRPPEPHLDGPPPSPACEDPLVDLCTPSPPPPPQPPPPLTQALSPTISPLWDILTSSQPSPPSSPTHPSRPPPSPPTTHPPRHNSPQHPPSSPEVIDLLSSQDTPSAPPPRPPLSHPPSTSTSQPPPTSSQPAPHPPAHPSHSPPPRSSQPTPPDPSTTAPPPLPDVWFEVSPHTSRVHFHAAADGSHPLGLSVPLDVLLQDPPAAYQHLPSLIEKHRRTPQPTPPAHPPLSAQQTQNPQPITAYLAGNQLPTTTTSSPDPASTLPLAAGGSPQATEHPSASLGTASTTTITAQQQQQWQPTDVAEEVCMSSATGRASSQALGAAALLQLQCRPGVPPFAAVPVAAEVPSAAQLQCQQDNATAPAVPAAQQPQCQGNAGTAAGSPTAMDGEPLPELAEAGPPVTAFMGPFGMVEVPCWVTRGWVEGALEEAAQLAREWRELRSVVQNKLYGKVVGSCLQGAVSDAAAEAAAGGAFGMGTIRYLKDAKRPLPAGACLKEVAVKYPRCKDLTRYEQPFSASGRRLCLHCFQGVDSRTPERAVLDGCAELFCSADCESRYFLRTSGSALRRALFRLEKGICQLCSLDCRALLDQLQATRPKSRRWREKRLAVLRDMAPRFAEGKRFRKAAERLVEAATPGNAWQADHIVPVYKGGGMCTLENLRTLCTPCHADVTKSQAEERAAERRRKALNTRDIRTMFAKGPAPSGSAPVAPPAPTRRGRKAPGTKRSYIDDDNNSGQDAVAARPAKAPRRQQVAGGQRALGAGTGRAMASSRTTGVVGGCAGSGQAGEGMGLASGGAQLLQGSVEVVSSGDEEEERGPAGQQGLAGHVRQLLQQQGQPQPQQGLQEEAGAGGGRAEQQGLVTGACGGEVLRRSPRLCRDRPAVAAGASVEVAAAAAGNGGRQAAARAGHAACSVVAAPVPQGKTGKPGRCSMRGGARRAGRGRQGAVARGEGAADGQEETGGVGGRSGRRLSEEAMGCDTASDGDWEKSVELVDGGSNWGEGGSEGSKRGRKRAAKQGGGGRELQESQGEAALQELSLSAEKLRSGLEKFAFRKRGCGS